MGTAQLGDESGESDEAGTPSAAPVTSTATSSDTSDTSDERSATSGGADTSGPARGADDDATDATDTHDAARSAATAEPGDDAGAATAEGAPRAADDRDADDRAADGRAATSGAGRDGDEPADRNASAARAGRDASAEPAAVDTDDRDRAAGERSDSADRHEDGDDRRKQTGDRREQTGDDGDAGGAGGGSAAGHRAAGRGGDRPTTALRVGGPPRPAAPPPPAIPPRPATPPPAGQQPTLEPTQPVPQTTAEPAGPPIPPKPTSPPPPADSERDPLELLAALTNRPPPPPTLWRSILRRVKIYTPLVVLLAIVVTIVQLLRPLPDPGLELTAAETFTFDGESPAVPWPEAGQAALRVDGIGDFGTSGEQRPAPIASLAKVMTAYVILRDHPLKPGEPGPAIPVDQQAEDDAGLSEEGESTVEVEAGDTISEYEALQAILLPSANNIARLLARWDAESEEAFVEKMNDTAAELGMKDTTYTDPSGLSGDTVSTAADQTRLAEAAMEDPVFREIVSLSQYEDSHGTTRYNFNPLVPVDGVIGIKTGTTSQSGGCLMFAAEQEVDGERQLILGTVLGQPASPVDNSILTGATDAGKALIDFAQDTLLSTEVFRAGEVVGHVDDGLGGTTPVRVTEDVAAVGWPGLEVEVSLVEETPGDDDGEGVPHTADAGTTVGSLRIGQGADGVTAPVELAEDLGKPGFLARLRRLG